MKNECANLHGASPRAGAAHGNPCARTRPASNPYETWTNGSWTWKVLKKYQSPEKEASNEYARWFCLVTSPFCPEGELGDVYVRDITRYAVKLARVA